MAQKKKVDAPVEEAVEKAPKAKKAPAAPKKNKERKYLEDFLVRLKKQPLTRREIINEVQQFLNKG